MNENNEFYPSSIFEIIGLYYAGGIIDFNILLDNGDYININNFELELDKINFKVKFFFDYFINDEFIIRGNHLTKYDTFNDNEEKFNEFQNNLLKRLIDIYNYETRNNLNTNNVERGD